jgi:type II secretory pathway pseudopilin PulG
MQLISLLAAISISAILASQVVSTWSTPRDASIAKHDATLVRSAIRLSMATAITTKTTQIIQMPITGRATQIRSFSGNQLEAYSDGSVSPGQVRLCGETIDWIITVSNLARTRVISERANC